MKMNLTPGNLLKSYSFPQIIFFRNSAFLVSVLGICVLTAFAYSFLYHQGMRAAMKQRSSLSLLVAENISQKINAVTDLGRSFAMRRLFVDRIMAGNWEGAMDILSGTLEQFPVFERIVLYDPAGIIRADMPTAVPPVIGQSRIDKEWYGNVMRRGQPYVSGVYVRGAEPKINVVCVAIPVRRLGPRGPVDEAGSGDVIGILQLQIRLDNFREWLKEIDIGLGGFAYVVDQFGRIVIHPRIEAERKIIDFSTVPVVSHLVQGRSGVEVAYNPIDKEEQLSAYQVLKGLGWGVVVAQPTGLAFLERDRQLQFLLISSIFVLGCTILIISLIFRALQVRLQAAEEVMKANEERLEAQERMIQSEKMATIGILSASIAHELKNPLHVIQGFSQCAVEKLDPGDVAYGFCQRILQASERMAKIIFGLLNFSRPASGEKEEVSCVNVVDAVLEFSARFLLDDAVQVEKDYGKNLPMVKADRNQLQQVMIVLLSNANDAMQGQGSLKIVARAVDISGRTFVEMEFIDNGCGIAPENMEKLFEPFFTTKERSKGTGLGLPVALSLIKDHGGDILVESPPAGHAHGTAFRIRLPAVSKI